MSAAQSTCHSDQAASFPQWHRTKKDRADFPSDSAPSNGSDDTVFLQEDSMQASEEWHGWMDWESLATTSQSQELSTKATTSTPTITQSGQKFIPRCQNVATPIPKQRPKLGTKKRQADDAGNPEHTSRTERKAFERKTQAAKNHSAVEKRYRTNLNQKIMELGACLPKLCGDGSGTLRADQDSSSKHNKGTILSEAIDYIRLLESRNKQFEVRVASLEKDQSASTTSPATSAQASGTSLLEQNTSDIEASLLQNEAPANHDSPSQVKIMAGSVSPTLTVSASDQPSPSTSTSSLPSTCPTEGSPSSQGLIKVPDIWRKLWRGEIGNDSDHSVTRQKSTSPNSLKGQRSAKIRRQALLGSAAGLAVIDNLTRHASDPNDRGLFAFPFLHHIRQIASSTRPISSGNAVSSLMLSRPLLLGTTIRLLFVACFLGLLLFIYLFTSRPPSTKIRSKRNDAADRSTFSNIDTPAELRQRAFLTAIQTIWVPRHHVLPEMLALNLETAAYVIRQLLGWQTYSYLTGRSSEAELARVRAWDIAIDAQLSGGDAEVSKSRLVLSLWASGTLPSTPARLMLKALHIRILFWRPSRFERLNPFFHYLAWRLARWQWNQAVSLQAQIDTPSSDIVGNYGHGHDHDLSPHLLAVLSMPVYEILTDDIVQRAHDLVWNTHAPSHPTRTQDLAASQTEDTAMQGPLDVVAAWHSAIYLRRCWSGSGRGNMRARLETALSCAPEGSHERVKAIELLTLLDERDGFGNATSSSAIDGEEAEEVPGELGLKEDQRKARRQSGRSDDTGYASLSEDDA